MTDMRDIFDKLAPVLIDQVLKKQGMKKPANDDQGDKVAVLKLHGAIMTGGKGLNVDTVQPKLEAISKMDDVKAIALDINSPGGSPVQSRKIANAIQTLAADKGVPVYAFVQDVAASGGYWIACAADEIFVEPESIVGSIGVVSAGFGFDKAIEKLGVERRVYTAGKSKVTSDPFQPENEEGVEMANVLRKKIHDNFIGWVSSQRPNLDTSEELFDGTVWIGDDAVKNGIADEIGGMRETLKAKFGDDIKIVTPVVMPSGLQDLFQMSHDGLTSFGEAVGRGAVNATADRAENEVTAQQFKFK